VEAQGSRGHARAQRVTENKVSRFRVLATRKTCPVHERAKGGMLAFSMSLQKGGFGV
jgi:hypothetical protein